jgi:hypothetical protein
VVGPRATGRVATKAVTDLARDQATDTKRFPFCSVRALALALARDLAASPWRRYRCQPAMPAKPLPPHAHVPERSMRGRFVCSCLAAHVRWRQQI